MRLFCLSTLLVLLAQNSFAQAAPVKTEQPSTRITLNDDKLHIYFCGTGVPDVGRQVIRKPACLAMTANNDLMLFDAGEGAVVTLSQLKLPIKSINKVFITHWHSDHFSGLGQVMNASWYSGRSEPLDVYGPYGVKEVVGGLTKAYRLDVLFRSINQKFDPNVAFATTHIVDANAKAKANTVYKNNDFSVSAFSVDHAPVYPAVGYSINYKGCKIVVSGDTKVDDSLAQNAKDADVLINEALNTELHNEQLSKVLGRSPEQLSSINSYHSDTLALAKMAQSSKVKKLMLTHLLPAIDTTDDAKKSFIKGMDQYYSGPITVADDRDEVIVEADGKGVCQVTYKPRSDAGK